MRARIRDLHSATCEMQKPGRRPPLQLSRKVAVGLLSLIGSFLPKPVFAEASTAIMVKIYNYSQASPAMLKRAEREAGRILGEAGVLAVWLECPVGPSTVSPQKPCQKAPEDTKIELRVLGAPIRNKSRDTVFGFTIHPVLASVYYEHVVRRAKNDNVEFDIPTILGCVIAHELGHLLLGPKGHSDTGIMRSPWKRNQIQQLMTGTLLFTTGQSKLIRAEAQRRMSPQTEALKEERLATADRRAEPKVTPSTD
jgi:hypothetical protein